MKVMMTGVGGMLGEAFYEVLSAKGYELHCSDIITTDEWISYLDFRNFNEYSAVSKSFRPDFLLHIGAHTSLEYCEENSENAYVTNTLSVENAVIIANSLDIPILYISTAGIFDGRKPVYDDWDVPNPLGVYARTKYLGERYVLENAKRHYVCRAGWMMGGGPRKDKKFINKIMKQIHQGQKKLYVVDDKDGTPTYTIDFATNCAALLETEYYGLYNMVCGGMTSRYEVASEIIKHTGLQGSVELLKVNSKFFEKEYYAPRPVSERLVNQKLELRGINLMRDWKICLAEYINDKYDNFL
jgi:dTDP-4-dehydrorhamnose reductase